MEMLNQKQKIVLIIIAIIAVGIVAIYYINSTKEIYSYEETSNEIEIVETKEEEKNIIVHITGAVKNRGIVEVKENARINDVVEAAGGPSKNADLNQVNLAYAVEDGQKIYIPSVDEYKEKTEEIIQEDAGSGVTKNLNETQKIININKANLQELCTLPGVGESTAKKIIQYRTEHGNFKKIEELKKVSGIGEAKYNELKSFVKI